MSAINFSHSLLENIAKARAISAILSRALQVSWKLMYVAFDIISGLARQIC